MALRIEDSESGCQTWLADQLSLMILHNGEWNHHARQAWQEWHQKLCRVSLDSGLNSRAVKDTSREFIHAFVLRTTERMIPELRRSLDPEDHVLIECDQDFRQDMCRFVTTQFKEWSAETQTPAPTSSK